MMKVTNNTHRNSRSTSGGDFVRKAIHSIFDNYLKNKKLLLLKIHGEKY